MYQGLIPQHEIENFVTPQRVKQALVLHLAMASSIVAFLFVIVVNLFRTPIVQQQDSQTLGFLNTLSIGIAIFSASVYVTLPLLNRIRLRGKSTSPSQPTVSQTDSESLQELENRYKTFFLRRIITLTAFEIPALCGLIVCMIAAINTMLIMYPLYWFNLIPAGILFLFLVLNFPSHDRIVNALQRQ